MPHDPQGTLTEAQADNTSQRSSYVVELASSTSCASQQATNQALYRRASGPIQGLELEELVGRGSCGSVYRGMWNGQRVAVKVQSNECVCYPACQENKQSLWQAAKNWRKQLFGRHRCKKKALAISCRLRELTLYFVNSEVLAVTTPELMALRLRYDWHTVIQRIVQSTKLLRGEIGRNMALLHQSIQSL